MRSIPFFVLSVCLSSVLAAQDPTSRPQPLPGQPIAGQPVPEVVKPEPTPQERIAELRAEIVKLQQEKAHLEKLRQSGGIKSQVRTFFKERELSAKTIVDTAAPRPKPETDKRGARLLGDEEKKKLGEGVAFTADGVPVTTAELDATLAFLAEARRGNDDETKQLAVLWLVRRAAAKAAFPETAREARNRILAIQRKLLEGAAFADVARESSDCPSKADGGALDMAVTRAEEGLDLFYRQAAFGTKVGGTSDIVESTFGYHLIQVTAGQESSVRTSHILTLYNPDQAQVRMVRTKVDGGQVDLAFASDELRQSAPPAYR
jgi:parvulin-like peptidyl-prolyl isomerase